MFDAKHIGWMLVLFILVSLACSDDKSTSTPIEDFRGFRYVGRYETNDRVYGVIVSGSYAYLAEHDSGMGIVNVSDPAHPVLTGRYRCPGALQVDLKGNYAYIADESLYSLEIVDVSDPTSPSLVGRLDTMEVLGIRVFGHFAAMGCGHDGLQIVDISNPASPFLTGCCMDVELLRFEIAGNHAFVPNGNSYNVGLSIVNLSNPEQPVITGEISTCGTPWEVAVNGDCAYMTNTSDWSSPTDTGYLYLIDISDLSAPKKIDSLSLGAVTIADYVADDHLYVSYAESDGTFAFCIYDISEPLNPQLVVSQPLPATPWDIWIANGYVYVGCDSAGMSIYEYRP